ncbi:helix-turn-helix domain-containing protein [Rhizobium rhizogenes]|uniref:helix-turn-helix domain-containing protein n=1 Tax=Rhizobium rhizogenes TaxID=359 RepID=UPI00226ECB8B|nr:helix-turn-helix transcriptional regulator [Rhizobium rhizogenes]
MRDISNNKSPSPIDVEVGRRIRLQRHVLGMSQSTLAKGLNVTFQQVQKYERGTNRVGASRLQRVAECLGVPISHFFDRSSDQSVISTDQTISAGNDLVCFLSSEEGTELNRAFANIKDAKTRQKIVGLVKSLATS